ncbi:MAG: ribonuclease H family protein [Flavobacteriaceae bacterium]|nr:ribonuclease H family protein [Flavobacteriaceae bacterium]
MSKKQKYYVVWEGRKKGIFTSWNECKKQIEGLKSVKYKSFKTKEVAKKAFNSNPKDYIGVAIFETTLSKEKLLKIGKPITKSISVDGACNNKGISEYQGVFTDTKTKLFTQGPFKGGSNNLMEFLALVHGLAYCKQHKLDLPIYSDSKTAISWVWQKKIKTTIKETSENKKIFKLIDRAIYWLKNNSEVIKHKNILKWETKAWGEIPADFERK